MNIDTKKLLELIEAFYNLTGVKVAIHNTDFKEILSYPKEHSKFCSLMRSNKEGACACNKSDEERCRKCENEKALIVEKCHAGLTEVIAPLSNGVSVIGYIMFGQITNEENTEFFKNDILARCKKYKFDENELLKAMDDILYYSDKQISDLSRIINALASYIIYSKLAFKTEQPVIISIIEYISEHLAEDLTVGSLCERFYVSKTELYKISRPFMPDGIADFIKKQRINKACDLLLYTDKPLSKIAEEVGFREETYFRKVFKKEKGISAIRYRFEAERKDRE